MTDYIPILESETDPEAPGTSSLWKRWAKNHIAAMEGAPGAPRLAFEAFPDLVAGSMVRFAPIGSHEVSGSLLVTALLWQVLQQGSLRLSFSHRGGEASDASIVEVLVSGVSIATYSTSGPAPVERSIDFPIERNQFVEVRHRTNFGFESSVLSDVQFSTDGTWIFPVSPVTSQFESTWSPV